MVRIPTNTMEVTMSLFNKIIDGVELEKMEKSYKVISLKEELAAEGFDPFAYDAASSGFVPYIIHLIENGELKRFFEVLDGRYYAVGWMFKSFSSEYIEKQFEIFKNERNKARRAKAQYILTMLKWADENIEADVLNACNEAYAYWLSKQNDEAGQWLKRAERIGE